MNKQVEKLYHIASKPERNIIGLMSGTSLDGLDIVLCKISGSGGDTKLDLRKFETIPYDDDLKKDILEIFAKEQIEFEKLCQLNPRIAVIHGRMILDFLQRNNILNSHIDLIASHGQTVFHSPQRSSGNENSTLQIGDGDHISVVTGIITISDFRQKNIAAGGEGAPLAVYGDRILFSKEGEDRLLLNIGGIANFTYLPGSNSLPVICTDTGPGNTMMDAFVRRNIKGKHFDTDGAIAASGKVNDELLSALNSNDFFKQPFPRTTGPELFNLAYLANAMHDELTIEDVMATLNKFSADTIIEAINICLVSTNGLHIYASGGGIHNLVLMQHLNEQLPGSVFHSTEDLGIDPNAKEAVLFAVLANECVAGAPWGSSRDGIPEILMGKISLPA
jgi:anhydro-N-acetylmuramic acid kinase